MVAESEPIGIVGLGLVGRAVAHRLLAAGYPVFGYDIDETACAAARETGVDVLPDAQAVARQAKTILLSLLTSENRRELMWGKQAMADTLQTGTLILDAITGRPEDIEEDAQRLAKDGVKLVDVCLSGSSHVIGEGRALALVGDREEDADYAGLLQVFSKAQYYFGAPGQGNRVKLIVNLVFGLNRLVLAEALGLAEHAGFDLGEILEVLRAGDTYSTVMDAKGPKMVSGIYEPPAARLAQHAKDVHLILEFALQVGAAAPMSETHAGLIDALVRDGWGDFDNAAIFEAYRL
ncbi:MAG TPA: NAD(P)-dependent oxidoreductase [Candidatus Bathyarchaeia archaeon]|nr:NAD(P)-dependent oxidoreductase [Candidatus Bathyarchaeia archaeon]